MKKYRKIVVNTIEFAYWHKSLYDDQFILIAHQLYISPIGNKRNSITLEFTANSHDKYQHSNIFADPNKLFAIYQKEDNKEETPPIIYYDAAHLYGTKAKTNLGEDAVLDWGKPKMIRSFIKYLLVHRQWKPIENRVEILDGWELLLNMGYSDFIPIISWSW